MPDENCSIHPERGCIGIKRAEEVAQESKQRTEMLERSLEEFKKSTGATHQRFGERIGTLESDLRVEKREVEHINGRLDKIDREMDANHREQKASIRELRDETKESFQKMEHGTQQILDIVTPIKVRMEEVDRLHDKVEVIEDKISPLTHKMGHVDELSGTVRQMQVKPAEKWEGMKDKFVMAFIGALGSFAFAAVIWLIMQVGAK